MLIELLSSSNYVNYNIKLAELLGLHSAIYLSEVMSINDKALRKDKVNENCFYLDRDYIKRRTTLEPKEQVEIEDNLSKLGIIERGESGTIGLNITTLTTIMMSTDEKLIDDIRKKAKKRSTRTTKADAIRDNLKLSIEATNPELRAAYESWIDSVVAKQGWMSKKAIVNAQKLIDSVSNRNLDIALSIIDIADINGYRDMQWAVNKYQEQHKVTYVPTTPTKPISANVALSSEVF